MVLIASLKITAFVRTHLMRDLAARLLGLVDGDFILLTLFGWRALRLCSY